MEPAFLGNKKRSVVKRLLQHLFPERQLFLRVEGRLSHARLSSRLQVFLTLMLFGAGAWIAFSSASFMLHDDVLAAKDDQIASARLAYRSLLGEVAEYQKKFTDMSGDLEEYHEMMLGLAEQNTALQRNLNTVESQLRSTRVDRQNVNVARDNLRGRLRELEDDMQKLANRNFALKDSLSFAERDLETTVVERNQALFDESRMRSKITELESHLVALQSAEHDVVQKLTERTVASLAEFTKIVELAGLDVEGLLDADETFNANQGGPFIKAGDLKGDGMPADALKASLSNLDSHLNQLEGVQTVLGKVPLSAPLDYFRVTSKFGKRRDPINHRWAMHYGLDMGGAYKSPVYATAPGVVTFAGWKGNYGRFVEIDHGAGIKTRYGHLNKTLVKKGQTIKFREKIGLLGNSGRSTGAHLHYEVQFKGRPKDPMKFIKAGRYVFQG